MENVNVLKTKPKTTTCKEVWLLQVQSAFEKRTGLRVFKEKSGALAEMENLRKPEWHLNDSWEFIREESGDLIRMVECFLDGEEAHEIARAIPLQVEEDLSEIWILSITSGDRPHFEAYPTKQKLIKAFLSVYEKAAQPLTSFYQDEVNLLPNNPSATNDKLNELAVATLCSIEGVPPKR